MAPRRPRPSAVARPAAPRLTPDSVGLADFTAETFAGRIGERFEASDADGHAHDLVLERCTVAPAEWRVSTAGRTPFSLLFLGPRDPVLPQRTYDLRHADLGAFQLFIVPTSRDADATRYEAVFT